MNKQRISTFVKAVSGMVLAALFPWIAGFLSALGELQSPFFYQTVFSHAVICHLVSLPLCLALLYLCCDLYLKLADENRKQPIRTAEEKSA